jgi:hypothetical protein
MKNKKPKGKEKRRLKLINIAGLFLIANSYIYFFSGFPQLVTTFTHRKTNLVALSYRTLLGQFVAGLFFVGACILTPSAWIAIPTTMVGLTIGVLQIIWKIRSPKEKIINA